MRRSDGSAYAIVPPSFSQNGKEDQFGQIVDSNIWIYVTYNFDLPYITRGFLLY